MGIYDWRGVSIVLYITLRTIDLLLFELYSNLNAVIETFDKHVKINLIYD